MSDARGKHADDHAQTAGTGRPRRFRKRVPSQELLQEDYEQNMMGATAGFFCAIWAGHLLGEHLSVALTTWSPADDQGIHRLAASDLGVVVLLATKVLFLRALVFRYILRPALKHLLGTVEFAQRQAVAETVGCVLWALLLVGPAMWILWVSSGGDGLGAMEKLFVVAQCAARVAGVAVGFLESRPLDRVLAQYLLAGSLFSAGMLGQIRTAALLVCTWELPGLFGRIGGGSLRHISVVFSLVARAVASSWIVYSAASASPAQHYADARWLLGTRVAFCASLAILTLLDLRRLASLAANDRSPAVPAKDAGNKKTQ